MEVLGYFIAILIGVSLGLAGSGGSILTVPVLVYLMHVNPVLATTSSLFIVGVTSLVGGVRAYAKGMVDFKAVSEFGLPSIFSIFITRHYILPSIPAHLFSVAGIDVSKDMFLMIFFALLMLFASFAMIRNYDNDENTETVKATNKHRVFPLMILGIVIGFITGLLGAGGGFLIIPSLVLFLRIRMKRAVGTSLLIIAINSLFGFLFSLKQFEFDWLLLCTFTALAIAGIFIGSKLADRIDSASLKKGFGWFVLLMAIYIIIKELFIK